MLAFSRMGTKTKDELSVIIMHPWARGGIRAKLLELVRGLIQEGSQVSYISPDPMHEVSDGKFKSIRTPVFPFTVCGFSFFSSYIPYFFMALLHVLRLTRKRRHVMVLCSCLDVPIAWTFRILNRGSKVVMYLHGDVIREHTVREGEGLPIPFSRLYLEFLLRMERFAFKRFDLAIFVSNYLMREIGNRANGNVRRVVVYHNLPQEIPPKEEPGLLSSENSRKSHICYVGRLSKEKGVEHLIRAFGEIRDRLPEYDLLIVGDGPQKEELVELTMSLNLGDEVCFLGWQRNPYGIISSSRLVVVPSITETFGIVILESFSCDVPVIGTNVGGIPEVLGFDSLMFPPANHKALASKMVALLENEILYKSAKDNIRERKKMFEFDWKGVIIGMLKDVCRET